MTKRLDFIGETCLVCQKRMATKSKEQHEKQIGRWRNQHNLQRNASHEGMWGWTRTSVWTKNNRCRIIQLSNVEEKY